MSPGNLAKLYIDSIDSALFFVSGLSLFVNGGIDRLDSPVKVVISMWEQPTHFCY
jgi:hypothetical protein